MCAAVLEEGLGLLPRALRSTLRGALLRGEPTLEPTDRNQVAVFLLGCSFSFEGVLRAAGGRPIRG